MKGYSEAKKHIDVSVGESVKIMREWQDLSQNELAEVTGIPQSTISAQINRPDDTLKDDDTGAVKIFMKICWPEAMCKIQAGIDQASRR